MALLDRELCCVFAANVLFDAPAIARFSVSCLTESFQLSVKEGKAAAF
jgi:hypothetical protein